MPVRLDPFQNIVGVNWGGRLAPLCDVFVNFGDTRIQFEDRDNFLLFVQLLIPETSGNLGLIDENEGSIALESIFAGGMYRVQFMGFQEGSGAFKPIANSNTFNGCTVIATDITGGSSQFANLRIFGRSINSSLPNVASVSTAFGFGPALVQPDSYWIQEGAGLQWSHFPITDPLPETLPKTFVQAQRERRRTRYGQRSIIRSIDGIGPVADFGTLRLNFRTGTAEMTQPENEET